ncbi:MAG TPA: hypothetical protein VIL23_01230 [Clostridia bacterium]
MLAGLLLQPTKMFLNKSKKIAYTAVLTALGVGFIMLGAFLPLSFVPFLGASLLLFYLFEKCGIIYGLMSGIAVSLLCVLFLGGNIAQVVPYMVLFAPHSLASYFLNKLHIKKPFLKYLTRYLILIPLFNISLYTIYRLAAFVLFDMNAFIHIVGAYYILAIIMSVVFILYDQAFFYIYRQLVRARIFR